MRINVKPVIARLLMPAIAVLFAAPAMAQNSAVGCADIEDDQERLACFDRVFSSAEKDAGAVRDGRTGEGADASRAAGRPSRAGGVGNSTRAGAAEPARDTAARNRSTTRSASRNRRSDAGSETAEDSFGLENKVIDLGGREQHSKAIGQFGFWDRGRRIELENGQVWQVVDDDEFYHKVTNPEVTIEAGMLGSHYLHLDGISKSVKVKRIR